MHLLVSGRELVLFTAAVASGASYIAVRGRESEAAREIARHEVRQRGQSDTRQYTRGEDNEMSPLESGMETARSFVAGLETPFLIPRRVPGQAQFVDEEVKTGEEQEREVPRRISQKARY